MQVIEGGEGRPPEPDWADIFKGSTAAIKADQANASRYWQTAADELQAAKKLSIVNGHALQRLVISYILYDRAAFEVMKNGAVVAAPKTGTPMHSPWWTAMRSADRMATQTESELCLSPRRRADGGTVKPKRKPSASDSYLKPVPDGDQDHD